MRILAFLVKGLFWICRHSPCPELTFFVLFFGPIVFPLSCLIVWVYHA